MAPALEQNISGEMKHVMGKHGISQTPGHQKLPALPGNPKVLTFSLSKLTNPVPRSLNLAMCLGLH